MQRMIRNIERLNRTYKPKDGEHPEAIHQKYLLVVFRAYFYDPARLTVVQRRLINANVIRRNRLIHAGNATKAPSQTELEQPRPPHKRSIARDAIQRSLVAGPANPLPLPSPSSPPKVKQGESTAGKSFVAQPATALESRFSITGGLTPPKTTKSAATKMSARVGHLDYPKCPAKEGKFPCPFCPMILTDEYTKKSRWRYVENPFHKWLNLFILMELEGMFPKTSALTSASSRTANSQTTCSHQRTNGCHTWQGFTPRWNGFVQSALSTPCLARATRPHFPLKILRNWENIFVLRTVSTTRSWASSLTLESGLLGSRRLGALSAKPGLPHWRKARTKKMKT